MGTGLAAGKNRGGGRLNSHSLHVRILFLEVTSGTSQRAASADAGNKVVDNTFSVTPDFRTSGFVVSLRIRGIIELTSDDGARILLMKFLSLRDGALHAVLTRGENNLSTIGMDHVAAFNRHRIRHDDDNLVAMSAANHGNTNTGVAGGRFVNRGTGLQTARLFSVQNDGLSDAVLHGTSRIEGFELRENAGLKTKLLLKLAQFDEGGIADQVGHRLINRQFFSPKARRFIHACQTVMEYG